MAKRRLIGRCRFNHFKELKNQHKVYFWHYGIFGGVIWGGCGEMGEVIVFRWISYEC